MDDHTAGKAKENCHTALNRRSYLKLGTAAGAMAGMGALLTGTGAAATVDLGEEGLSEGDRIDSYLDQYFESGATVRIPPGTYEWRGDGLGGHYSDAALIGGGDPGDVELTAPDGSSRYLAVRGHGGEVRLENLLITGSNSSSPDKFRAEARDSDCDVILENVWLPDGTESDGMGFFVGGDHAGTITFRNCWVEGFGDNGLYASAPGAGADGAVIVEGGLYKNNNIANVRIGSSNSVVRGATLVNTEVFDKRSAVNMRNLRIRQPGDDIVVEDCDIYHAIGQNRPVDFSSQISSGSGVIRDTRIYTESSSGAIRSHDGDWVAENVHITGSGDHSTGISTSGGCTGSSCDVAASRPRAPLPNSRETGTEQDDDQPEMDPHLVTFITAEDAPVSEYRFVADGPIDALADSPYDSPSGNAIRATSNYEITREDDEYVAAGTSANGYGDAFEVYGAISEASVESEDMVIELDGDRVGADELVERTQPEEDDGDENGGDTEETDGSDDTEGTDDDSSPAEDDQSDGSLSNVIVVDGSASDDVSQYVLTVSGELERSEAHTSIVSEGTAWDTLPSNVSDDRAIGVVGQGADGYRYSGNVISVEVRGDAALHIDRE